MLLAVEQMQAADLSQPQGAAGFTVYRSHPWPDGELPVYFPAAITAGERALFMDACREWTRVAPGVRCVSPTGKDAIEIRRGSVCRSTVGRYLNTKTEYLELGPKCWNQATIIHELGHALGLMHEHQRPDRDTDVSVDFTNIEKDWAYNLDLFGTGDEAGSYDFLSVMHYGQYTLAIDPSRPTMIARPPYQQYQATMGTSRLPTALDGQTMARMYPGGLVAPGPVTDVTATPSASGTALTVAWQFPSTGALPTAHQLVFSYAPGGAPLYALNVGPETTVTIPVPATTSGTFYVTVTPISPYGNGPASEAVPFPVGAGGACLKPAAPTGVSGSVSGGQVHVTWNPSPGADFYIMRAGLFTGGVDLFNGSVGNVTSVTAPVPAGFQSYIRVYAANACGESPASIETHIQ
jgi:hypothetical protein